MVYEELGNPLATVLCSAEYPRHLGMNYYVNFLGCLLSHCKFLNAIFECNDIVIFNTVF